MLSLARFHLTLTRVVHDDIETIRQGRNQEHVRLQHIHQSAIEPAEQERWFQAINNRWNYFFVIQAGDRKVGMVYVKDFTEHMATSSCGVFIWDRATLASRVPLLAVLTVLDFFFGELRGGSTESIVLRSNAPAMRMNEFFDFAFADTDVPEQVRIYMDLPRYLAARERLLGVAERIIKSPAAQSLVLSGTVSALNFEVINQRLLEQAAAQR